jgi:hypothetical protein
VTQRKVVLRHLIFDAEIIKAIHDPKKGERLDGIEYCAGWGDHAGMGIATVSMCWLTEDYDPSNPDEPFVFDWTNQQDRRIATGYLTDIRNSIGGFNTKKFDDKLFRANGVEIYSQFDIFEMVLMAAGWHGKNYWSKGLKYNLEAITQANGMGKSGDSALIPIKWQKGEKQQVLDHCKNDAYIEREVLRLLAEGELIDPNTGQKLEPNLWSYKWGRS